MQRFALALILAFFPLFAAGTASACGMYRPVTEADLMFAEDHMKKGDSALAQKELRSAVRHYNRAMSAPGKHTVRAKAALKAGQVYARLGRSKVAVRRFQRAIRISPLFAEGHLTLGFALLESDAKKAIVHLEGALAASAQGTADAHAGLAIAYARAGEAKKAKTHLQNARLNGASVERIIAAEKVIEQGVLTAIADHS